PRLIGAAEPAQPRMSAMLKRRGSALEESRVNSRLKSQGSAPEESRVNARLGRPGGRSALEESRVNSRLGPVSELTGLTSAAAGRISTRPARIVRTRARHRPIRV